LLNYSSVLQYLPDNATSYDFFVADGFDSKIYKVPNRGSSSSCANEKC